MLFRFGCLAADNLPLRAATLTLSKRALHHSDKHLDGREEVQSCVVMQRYSNARFFATLELMDTHWMSVSF